MDTRLPNSQLALLRQLPKIELHAHLSGCLRKSTVIEIARRSPRLRALSDPELVRLVTLVSQSQSYGTSFTPWRDVIDFVTSLPDYAYRLALEVAEDMANDGVVYAELRIPARVPFDPSDMHYRLAAFARAAQEGIKRYGIDIRAVVGFDRQSLVGLSERQQRDLAFLVLEAVIPFERRVVGFDLYGVETDCPPVSFVSLFETLRGSGYPLTIHAGEDGEPNYVRQAIVELGATRIGHGLGALHDNATLALAKESGIFIEVCPTSNYLTSVVESFNDHPIARLVESGVNIVVCSDNTLVYSTTLTNEYVKLVTAGLLSSKTAIGLPRASLEAAFLTESERLCLQGRLCQDTAEYIAALDIIGSRNKLAA